MTVYELIKNASKEELAFALISLDDIWYDDKTEQYKSEYCNHFCTDCYTTASSEEFIDYLKCPELYAVVRNLKCNEVKEGEFK